MPALTPEQKSAACKTIIAELSNGTTLRSLCRQEGMPNWRTFYDWMAANPELAAQVAHARDLGFEALAEDVMEIVDGTKAISEHVQLSKLRIETRLKLLACWNPKKYGNKTTLQGDKDAPLETKTTVELAKGTAAELAKTMRAVAQAKDEAKDIL